MLLKNDVEKLISELANANIAKIELGGCGITVRTCQEASKMSLSTPVYFGGNYIPKSVRNCLKQRNPFHVYSIRTDLVIDEENFRIYLNYFGEMSSINQHHFIDLLEDFIDLADKWREYLDQHDQNDLVYIMAR